MQTKPEDVIKMAVEGMLPKTRLGKQMLSKLKVYAGDKHPHSAQLPAEMIIK
jgi:large subunit ribosomal protein L13